MFLIYSWLCFDYMRALSSLVVLTVAIEGEKTNSPWYHYSSGIYNTGHCVSLGTWVGSLRYR